MSWWLLIFPIALIVGLFGIALLSRLSTPSEIVLDERHVHRPEDIQ